MSLPVNLFNLLHPVVEQRSKLGSVEKKTGCGTTAKPEFWAFLIKNRRQGCCGWGGPEGRLSPSLPAGKKKEWKVFLWPLKLKGDP